MQILLVEDDPRDLRLIMKELQLEDTEAHIQVARDGEEALDFLFCRGMYSSRQPCDPPHLVLLDLKLPKIDGLQVLREIKNSPELRAIPVVTLTSSAEERDMVECYKLGANSYVQKPVNFDRFRETIRTVKLYWIAINQKPPEKAFTRDEV